MGSGDLSTDLALNILTPAPAARAGEGHSPSQDAQGKARRGLRRVDENQTEENPSFDLGDQPAHQFDDLA